MATSVRIKVRVDALVEKVKEAKAAAVADHAKRVEEAKASRTDRKAMTIAALKAALEQTRKGELPEHKEVYLGYRHNYVDTLVVPVDIKGWDVKVPVLDTSVFDQDIALLEMASDETLSIGVGDRWGRYL